MSEKDHKHYNSSKNTARNIEEVKKTRMYVERKDGTNISGIIIPHDAQIGINDDNFRSNLGVKGDLKVEGKIYDKDGNEFVAGGGGGGDISISGTPNVNEVPFFTNSTTVSGSQEFKFLNDGLQIGKSISINNVKQHANGSFTFAGQNKISLIQALAGYDVVVLGGEVGLQTILTNQEVGSDVNVILSGTVGSRGTSTRGTALVSGDMMMSGSLHVTNNILPGSTPTDGQVIAWDNANQRLYWKTAGAVALAFTFASSIASFTESDISINGFASANAFDPRTNGTYQIATTIETP